MRTRRNSTTPRVESAASSWVRSLRTRGAPLEGDKALRHGPANPREITLLAQVIAEKEGHPGRQQPRYRREVRLQLLATRHLLEQELERMGASTVDSFAPVEGPRPSREGSRLRR